MANNELELLCFSNIEIRRCPGAACMASVPNMDATALDETKRTLEVGRTPTLGLGVLGASRIVPKALQAALSDPSLGISVVALGARTKERAESFGRAIGLPVSFGSYDEVIHHPQVEALYVATPCSEHASLATQALLSGKHVLCEKPFALSLSQARQVVALAQRQNRVLMEAHHWRYHSMLDQVGKLISSLGGLNSIVAEFRGGIDSPGDIRRNPLLGPGVTMDFGCYCLQWVSWVSSCGAMPALRMEDAVISIEDAVMEEAEPGVDVTLRANMLVDGIPTRIWCDMRPSVPFFAQLVAEGSLGRVVFENPLVVEGSVARLIPSDQGRDAGLAERVYRSGAATTTYREQLKAFRHAVQTGELPVTSGESIIFTQALLDELYAKAGLLSRLELRERTLQFR